MASSHDSTRSTKDRKDPFKNNFLSKTIRSCKRQIMTGWRGFPFSASMNAFHLMVKFTVKCTLSYKRFSRNEIQERSQNNFESRHLVVCLMQKVVIAKMKFSLWLIFIGLATNLKYIKLLWAKYFYYFVSNST